MLKCAKYWFTIMVMLFFLGSSFAQTDRKEQLQRLKIRLQDEIELANKILTETRKDKTSSIGAISTVEQKLKLRKNLIRTIDRELELLEKDIQRVNREVDTLQVKVDKLKEDYANMIRQAYKSKSRYSRLMFLLSSRDFNQALRRMEYLRQYSEFRRRQVEEIKQKQIDLNEKINELNLQKVRKSALKDQMDRERLKLEEEKVEQERSIEELKSREEEITKDLKSKVAQAKKLENEIQRIIAAEIRKEKERAIRRQIVDEAKLVGLIEGKDFTSRTNNNQLKSLIEKKKRELKAANQPVAETTPSKASYSLTPEASQLAANFAANRSRLLWPVERGLVITRFGPHRHPAAPSVIINSNGIDIATEPGSSARAVFEGEVTWVTRVPGEAIAILIKHGNYFTLYSYLSDVTVKSGDKVTRGQILGRVHKSSNSDQFKLHFEVWKETQILDPMPWLAGK